MSKDKSWMHSSIIDIFRWLEMEFLLYIAIRVPFKHS